jgi:Threonine dehydratase
MLTLKAFEEAVDTVQKVTIPTNLVYSSYFSEQSGNKVYLKPENMNYFYGSIAQYWQSEGKFIGQENYDSQINRVCSYQNGESYDNGSRYNLISVVSNNKIIAVAYLDDNKIKHPNGMPE